MDAKSKGKPVGGAPPVHIPPLDAAPLERGGTMHEQASVLSDPTSPLSPAYTPAMDGIVPQQPKIKIGPAPNLSQETVEGLEALAKFQKDAEANQKKVAAEQDQRVAEASAKEMEEIKSILGDDSKWSVLNNYDRRKAIESRLKPLDIADILIHGEIRQNVPIVPDKFVITLRSVSGDEDLGVKKLMSSETGSDRYMFDKLSFMALTLGIVAINGKELPAHLNDQQRFDEALFKAKFDLLMRYPVTMLADMGLQYYWFEHRVQDLFADQTNALKNS